VLIQQTVFESALRNHLCNRDTGRRSSHFFCSAFLRLLSAAVGRFLYSLGDVDGVIGNRVLLCPRFPPGFASGLEFRVPVAGCMTADVTLGAVLTWGDHRH
jgi:hypothetical protein